MSESWLKDKHPCLVFVGSTYKRQRESGEKADYDQDQESDDSDLQNVQVEDSPEESEHESEHSCHDPSCMMPILSPHLSAPEVVRQCIVRSCWLFILNVTFISQAEVARVCSIKDI